MSILTVYIWLMVLDVNFTSMMMSQMLSRVLRKFMFITKRSVFVVIFIKNNLKISPNDQWIVAPHLDRCKWRLSLAKNQVHQNARRNLQVKIETAYSLLTVTLFRLVSIKMVYQKAIVKSYWDRNLMTHLFDDSVIFVTF